MASLLSSSCSKYVQKIFFCQEKILAWCKIVLTIEGSAGKIAIVETKQVIERYGIYYDYISKLEQLYPLSDVPTIKELGITRAHLQRAYKEMKAEKFSNSIGHYFVWLSFEYRLFQVVNAVKDAPTEDLKEEFREVVGSGYFFNALRVILARLKDSPSLVKLGLVWKRKYPDSDFNFMEQAVKALQVAMMEKIMNNL